MPGIQAPSSNITKEIATANKDWEDLTFEERIERMTQVIEQNNYELNRLSKLVGELLRHKHDDAGKIYVPHDIGASIYEDRYRGNPLKRKQKQDYFAQEEVSSY